MEKIIHKPLIIEKISIGERLNICPKADSIVKIGIPNKK